MIVESVYSLVHLKRIYCVRERALTIFLSSYVNRSIFSIQGQLDTVTRYVGSSIDCNLSFDWTLAIKGREVFFLELYLNIRSIFDFPIGLNLG